jgi:type VI protein secretion system component Hcp
LTALGLPPLEWNMKSRRFIALCSILLAAQTCPVGAQIYLRLQGITGVSADTNHLGWMDVQSGTVAALAFTTGHPNFGDLCYSKLVDSASPALAFNCAKGNLIANGTVDFTDVTPSQARYLRLNLTNIFLTAVHQSGDGQKVEESLCLSPQIYSWNYTQFRSTNGLPAGRLFSQWDMLANNGALGTTTPALITTGIRNSNGVELDWTAKAGQAYGIFAVPALNQPFQLVAQFTATNDGNTNYTFVPVSSAMFYTVLEIPNGY